MRSAAILSQVELGMPDTPCCLIVEDQVLIAMSIEASLEEAGYGTAGPFTNNSQAIQWLADHHPYAAILDYKLADGACTELARALNERGIPFVVYSGHARYSDIPGEFGDVPWIEKPCAPTDILTALQQLKVRGEHSRNVAVSPQLTA